MRGEILEVRELNVLQVLNLIDDAHDRWGEFLGAVRLLDRHWNVGLDATELLQEVDMEIRATKLAVSDTLQAHVLLQPDRIADGAILHFAQLRGRYVSFRGSGACLLQKLRPQQTADMIRTKRWRCIHERPLR
jgi:hypothetical protein